MNEAMEQFKKTGFWNMECVKISMNAMGSGGGK